MTEPPAEGLRRFVSDREWIPVLGTYLYPLRYFGQDRSTNPIDYLEVMKVIHVADRDIAITRGSGLFVRFYEQIREIKEAERVARLLNLVICEFALAGINSSPANDTDIQMGKLIGRHIAIIGGFGEYGHRTWGPISLVASRPSLPDGLATYWPPNFYWHVEDPAKLESIGDLRYSTLLLGISKELPALLATAASHAAQHDISETILSAWIVCEMILAHHWRQYIAKLDSARRKRLDDHRTYTAAVQTETLLTTNCLDYETYVALHDARRVRNDLAHGAQMSLIGAETVVNAMQKALGTVGVDTTHFRGFVYMSGGFGPPDRQPEPVFPFK